MFVDDRKHRRAMHTFLSALASVTEEAPLSDLHRLISKAIIVWLQLADGNRSAKP